MNMNYLCSQYWPRSSLLKSFKDLCPTLYRSAIHIGGALYKQLKKGAHQSHLGRQKMGWFLTD